ncbi:Alpha-(N-acetylaminomethylene)succinic acid hydrolase [Thermobacillus xylanilyticus]|jgi:N-formylmaleamate deformylase|uniref:Alpha-(N-acetylaminomethylene)succinic acid hydrolase n=1 Tax=Thermobacillus xylanilyticus TaxID=76633 RepID=A0ABN7RSI1_THEXY|nr:alpha/beta hydrolase [Thermobacillus xylanilyticus]REJ14922.1 MAG: hypothetical protein C6W59_09575 [Paenibacillaceae bacterium]CAG5084864.1 Alpha-(N-acetylaminomethylene)succinic acid hydrolase [Thermobacillus xylanilyticus]
MMKRIAFDEIGIEAGGVQLYAAACGDPGGEPVIFLHGISENGSAFGPIMAALPQHRRYIALDLRGRGRSGKPASGYAMRDYIADLLALWNALPGGGKPALIGHSMGARIAAAFAAAYPELTGRVMMIDPPLSGPGRPPFPLPLARFTVPKAMLDAGDLEAFRAHYAAIGIDPEAKARELKACAPEAIEQSYLAMNEEPFHVWYRLLRVPARLVACGGAPFIGPAEARELEALNPSVDIRYLPEAGHELHKREPETTIRLIREFLEGR